MRSSAFFFFLLPAWNIQLLMLQKSSAHQRVDQSQIKCFQTACMHASLFQVLDDMTFNSVQREVSSIVWLWCRRPEGGGGWWWGRIARSWQVKMFRQSEGNKRGVQISRWGVNLPEVTPQICLTFPFYAFVDYVYLQSCPEGVCAVNRAQFDKAQAQENTSVAFSLFSTTP